MAAYYACTAVEKLATDYHPDTGAETTSRTIIAEACNVRARTLPELLEKLEQRYTFQPILDLFIPGDDDEEITHIGHNQFEDRDGNPVDGSDGPCYLCDYTFAVEVREVRPLTPADIPATVKTH